MPKNTKSINDNLFRMLKSHGYEPTPLDSNGKKTPVPDEADVFQFKIRLDHGGSDDSVQAIPEDVDKPREATVTVSIDDNHDLKVYYNNDASEDDNWYSLLRRLKNYAVRNQLGFDPTDEDQLTYDMAKRQKSKADRLRESIENGVKHFQWTDYDALNLKIEDRLSIAESFYTHKGNLFESNDSQKSENFLSLTNMSSPLVKNKKYIITMLGMINNKIIQMQSPEVVTLLSKSPDGYKVSRKNGDVTTFPDKKLTEKMACATFFFDSIDAYEKFSMHITLKYDFKLSGKNPELEERSMREGKWTHNAKTGAKLHPKTGEELPPKEKPLTMKQMFSKGDDREPEFDVDLDDVWREFTIAASNVAPDIEPYEDEHFRRWLKRHGITGHKIGDVLDAAAKKHDYDSWSDYSDSIRQYARDNMAEATRAPRAKKPKLFRIDGPQRLRHAMKDATKKLGLSIETQGYSDDSSTKWTIVVHNAKFTSAEQLETAIRGAIGDYQAYLDVSKFEFNEGAAKGYGEYDKPLRTFTTITQKYPSGTTVTDKNNNKYRVIGHHGKEHIYVQDVVSKQTRKLSVDDLKQDVAEGSKEGKHPNNELGRAQKYFKKHGDADMSYEDIVDMMMDADFSEEIAKEIASDSGRVDKGVAEGLNEMDKSAPQPGRDGKVSHSTYGSRDRADYFNGEERPAKRITVKQAEQDALDILNKSMKKHKKLKEGYHAAGRRASYNDAIPQVKILVQHTRPIEEGEQRFRNVERIFVENVDGERIRVPTNNTAMARTFARLIAEGDKPYGDRWEHLRSLAEDYSKIRGVLRATGGQQLSESVGRLIAECGARYAVIRESLHRLSTHRGYHSYFESWTPTLLESDTAVDISSVAELLGEGLMSDPRISEALDVLGRINATISENSSIKEVDELAQWAENIIDEAVDDESGEDDPDKDTSPEEWRERGMMDEAMDAAHAVMQQIAAGELELYDVMNKPQDDAQKQCSRVLHDMYERIAGEKGLHPDDDFEEIESYMLDELEDEYGTGEDTPHDDGLRDSGDDSSIEDLDAEIAQMDAELDAELDNDPAIREMDNRSESGDRREQRAASPEAKKSRHKEYQDNLKKTPKKLRDKLRLPDPDDEVKENLDADQKRAGQWGPTGGPAKVGDLVGEGVDPELAAIRRLSGLK